MAKVPNGIKGLLIMILLVLLIIEGRKLIIGVYHKIDEKRYPEYYQIITPIKVEYEKVTEWFIEKIENVPDTVSNPDKYKSLLKDLYMDYNTSYERRLYQAEIKFKKYYGFRTSRVNTSRLAKKSPFEFLDYLSVIDSAAHDSISNEFFSIENNQALIDLSIYYDSIRELKLMGVYLDSSTINYLKAILPNNEYIESLKKK